MKILHLLDERWDSGITSYALQISEQLQKAGHSVVLGIHIGKKPDMLAKKLGVSTAPINSVLELLRLLKSEPWDIVNVHSGRSHTWAVLFKIFFQKNLPIVRTRGDARSVPVHPLSRFIYKYTAAVIAASDHISNQYIDKLKVNPDVCGTVYPSVKSAGSQVNAVKGRVGILGRLDPVKGHSSFLEAAALVLKEMPEARFWVAGREAGLSVSLLKNQADLLTVSQAVQFVGFQESAEDFMRSCEVGVIASLGSEEISRACLEWLAVGRPVVGTLVGSLPELIEPGENGYLVPPGDSASMAKNILALLQNPQQRETFGRNASRLAQLKFGPDVQLTRTLDIYQNAIRRAKTGHLR